MYNTQTSNPPNHRGLDLRLDGRDVFMADAEGERKLIQPRVPDPVVVGVHNAELLPKVGVESALAVHTFPLPVCAPFSQFPIVQVDHEPFCPFPGSRVRAVARRHFLHDTSVQTLGENAEHLARRVG